MTLAGVADHPSADRLGLLQVDGSRRLWQRRVVAEDDPPAPRRRGPPGPRPQSECASSRCCTRAAPARAGGSDSLIRPDVVVVLNLVHEHVAAAGQLDQTGVPAAVSPEKATTLPVRLTVNRYA